MNMQEIIKQAVDRFLCWRLPEDFAPDGGISFDRSGHKYEPVGTNLLTAEQANQMFSHCLPTIPPASSDWEVLEKLQADTLRFMVVDLQNGVERMDVSHRTERAEWLELEKQYAERLGRLAQLCDVVCGWIDSGSNHCTLDEMNAAKEEIMDYVDAVRP